MSDKVMKRLDEISATIDRVLQRIEAFEQLGKEVSEVNEKLLEWMRNHVHLEERVKNIEDHLTSSVLKRVQNDSELIKKLSEPAKPQSPKT